MLLPTANEANQIVIGTEAIGNGSKAKALVSSYSWTYKNKKGVSPSLKKLVVTELVEYSAASGISADDEDVL